MTSTPTTVSKIQKQTQDVEGFLSQNGKNLFEGEVLYHLARRSPADIVEIGSWKGKSTIWLGKGSEVSQKKRVYAIDPHTGSKEHQKLGKPVWTFEEFKKNITNARLSKNIIPILKTSAEGVYDIPAQVGFVFIDGAHDYASVKKDFETWIPKLKLGGFIAFHDSFGYGWPEVRQFVHKEIFKSSILKEIRYINGITYGVKVDQTTLLESLKNRLNLFIKATHETSLYFPQPLKSLTKKLIWRPFQKKWLKHLRKLSRYFSKLDC